MGQQLQNKAIRSEDELEKIRAECKKWSEYNKQLLSQLFSNSSMADRCWIFNDHTSSVYGWLPGRDIGEEFRQLVARFQKKMDDQINDLKGIHDELELIPEQHSHSSNQDTAIGNKVFVVHGRDLDAANSIARVVEKLGLEAIILHEKPDEGKTIIEKLEARAKNASFAIVLFTPDDVGTLKGEADLGVNPRARQNVIFELGYFIGKLGRERVRSIFKSEVELPSDIDGILYIKMDEFEAWKQKLTQELASAGIAIERKSL
ncbi:MAG: nucleotide-binding protein [Candidatus Poribacteria bacterium]|nr:nucleotide-binding protein [Candidatus Poribacteria bacterium]